MRLDDAAERRKIKSSGHGHSDAPLTVSLVDPVWELVDPVPDVHALFCTYNDQFFWGKLLSVSVSWSPRMTLCAGVCSYERRGGLCSIRLSVPLLKLRPRSDLIETLLHEMIHAYLFVTANNRDRDGHGPEFLKHMHRINAKARTKISVYHSFHDEVAVYQQHVWQCSGPCRQRRPYYGLVKRSMNRAPGPYDRWWSEHKRTCGGTYTKIKEPESYRVKGIKRKATLPEKGAEAKRKASTVTTQDIRNYFTGSAKSLSGIPNGVSKPSGGSNLSDTNVRTVTHKPSSSSAVSNSNIRGFGSTSSGAIKAVEVGNASRSKIVGFNKGLNKSRSNSVNKNEGGNHSSWGKGRSGGGLALGSGGTLVLNPKANSKTATIETGSEVASNRSEPGFVLGSNTTKSRSLVAVNSASEGGSRSQRPVSRLLTEYDAAVALKNSKKQQKTQLDTRTNSNRSSASCLEESSYLLPSSLSTDVSSTTQQLEASRLSNSSSSDSKLPDKAIAQNSLSDSDESDEGDIDGVKICPLCEHSIHVNNFLSHISVCMGDWNEDGGLEIENLDTLNKESVSLSNSNKNESADMMPGTSVTPGISLSNFFQTSQRNRYDTKLFGSIPSKNKHRRIMHENEDQNDDNFISVSDSDEEFDEKYRNKPVLSVVQLARDINKLGVDKVNGRGACSSQAQSASSACERENVGTNAQASANAPLTFPCPVCGELYTEEYITSVHINTHFD
ncbi:SprT-like [Trinorchestia longiramus]|nr:SprT-like [Trinorchestia longiramus]